MKALPAPVHMAINIQPFPMTLADAGRSSESVRHIRFNYSPGKHQKFAGVSHVGLGFQEEGGEGTPVSLRRC